MVPPYKNLNFFILKNFHNKAFFSVFGCLGNCFGIIFFCCQPLHWCWLLLHSKSSYETITRSKSNCKTDYQRRFNKEILNRDGHCKRMGLKPSFG